MDEDRSRILVRVETLSDEMYETLSQFGEVEVVSKFLCIYSIKTSEYDPCVVEKISGVLEARYPRIGSYNVEYDEKGYLTN